MFDRQVSVLGMPLDVVIFALATVLWFVGFRALMRITGGEPTVRSFRATGHREPGTVVLWVGTAVFAALAVLALVATVA